VLGPGRVRPPGLAITSCAFWGWATVREPGVRGRADPNRRPELPDALICGRTRKLLTTFSFFGHILDGLPPARVFVEVVGGLQSVGTS